jgi:hypothetical protein
MTDPTPKKGHWPKGKARTETPAGWPKTRQSLADLLAEHPVMGDVSAAVLAAHLGVSGAKTVTRWLAGPQCPDGEMAELIASWTTAKRTTPD